MRNFDPALFLILSQTAAIPGTVTLVSNAAAAPFFNFLHYLTVSKLNGGDLMPFVWAIVLVDVHVVAILLHSVAFDCLIRLCIVASKKPVLRHLCFLRDKHSTTVQFPRCFPALPFAAIVANFPRPSGNRPT